MRKKLADIGLKLVVAGALLTTVLSFPQGVERFEKVSLWDKLPKDGGWCLIGTREEKYASLIDEASAEFGVPKPLIAAVIMAESAFDPLAISPMGAMGLMQLMPDTWKALGGSGSPFNPRNNIRMGAKYLGELLGMFRGNLRLVLAAYNAGPGAVIKSGGVPSHRETRRYVPRVLDYYREFIRSKDFA